MDTQSKQPQATKERKRSRLYPRYDLENAVDFIKKVDELGGTISLEALAGNLGLDKNNSGLTGRISATKQFGFLAVEGKKLSLTDLALRMLRPVNDTDGHTALVEGFTKPELYTKLIQTYRGRKLPEQKFLGNILNHEYGIQENARLLAAGNFIRSAEYVGVIQNDILVMDDNLLPTATEKSNGTEQSTTRKSAMSMTTLPSRPILTDASVHEFIFAGGIKLTIPKSISKADEGIADGELKTVKDWAKKFAENYSKTDNQKTVQQDG